MKVALPWSPNPDQAAPPVAGVRARRKRKRSLWGPILAVIVVGAVLAGGAYYWRAQQATAATPQTLPVPVVKGDLNVNIESSGQVAPNRSFAVPLQTAGQVREVLVKAGDLVKQGQPLVRVDDGDLRLAVGQDEANLKTAQAQRAALDEGPTAAALADVEATLTKAQENLKTVQAGAGAPEIAAAEADVRSAQLKLDNVQAGAAKQEIAEAEADVKTAQLKLDKVQAGATAAEIAEAEADVKTAQLKLDKVKAGATTAEIAEAEAEVRSAQLKLDQLKEGPGPAERAAAQAALTAAQEKLAALQAGPTEAERRSKELAVSQAENTLAETRDTASATRQKAEYALDKADHDLKNAQDDYNQIAEQVLNADGAFKSDLPQSLINQYNSTLRGLQDAENAYRQAQTSLEDARRAEIRQVDEAQARLDDAQKQLQELLAPPTAAALAEAQATVHNAQKTLDSLLAPPGAGDLKDAENAILKAQNNLADLRAGPSATDLEEAQAALLKAQNNLADLQAGPSAADLEEAQAALLKAQNNLADLRAGPSATDLADAQAALIKAQNSLRDLRAKPTAADLSSAQSQVVSAASALAKLTAPPTESDLASADAVVLQAEAALAQSRHELEQATLVAPFDGTVAAVTTEVGSLATAGEKVVTLNDESRLHLAVKLSESDVAKVKVDQPVNITFDALPGKTITGTITSVATVASVDQNVVTYLVEVQLHPDALPVKVGMSGTAGIQVEQRTGVLQVPNRAIKSTGGVKTIQVLYGKDKTPVTVRVQTGATNGQMTEIVRCMNTNNQCLREGDTVALELSGTGTARGPGTGDVMTFGPGMGVVGPPPGGAGDGPSTQIFIGP